MKIDRRSLVFRLLVPIVGVIVLISVVQLVLLSRITGHILEDYHRATLSAHGDDARRILETAVAELSTARLLDNRAVTEVKQQTVIEALSLAWKAHGIDGIIIGPAGTALFSTLPADTTEGILVQARADHFHVVAGVRDLQGLEVPFAPWQWRVLVLSHTLPPQQSRREVVLLVPLVALGSIFMVGMLLLVLQRRLQQPVAALVEDAHHEREISPTGVAEFDRIGEAMNEAFARVRERTAAALAQDERIRLLLASTAEGIYGVDRTGICTFCNRAGLRMLGYGAESEVLGRNIHELIHHSLPDGRFYPEAECRIYAVHGTGQGIHVDDEVFWRKDGTPVPVEYWSYPVVDRGAIAGAVVTFVDISERKKAEAALRDERNKFEAIIAAMGEGLSIQDRGFRVLYQNEVHQRMVGVHGGELCYQAYQSKKELCPGCPVAKAYDDGRVHVVERTRDTSDGLRYYEVAASPLRNSAGEIVAGIELVRDVTERKRTESQLQQAQKMEAIGQLAGGVAHDFNNILTAITGYASFLKLKTEEGSNLRHYGEQILFAAERAANLTRQILAFSRKQVIKPRPVNINDIVRGMEKMMGRLLGEDIDVRIELREEDATVMADAGQIEQVLLNLATNARDAMPSGGTLHIRTETAEVSAEAAAAKGLKRPGRYAVVAFSDTGQGMTEKVRQRIFEPFFTTKEMGRGTGLGLSIVYGIVTQHEGQISVYSEPGQGTSFRIYLPLVTQTPLAPKREEAGHAGKGETILLAEDDAAVREIARLTLEEAGYRVIIAVDGEDAVTMFRKHRSDVRLCLFDLIMPKKNGKSALTEIREVAPDVRSLFMSGYAADIIKSKDLADDTIEILEKPLVPEELLKRVRSKLDDAG